MMRLAIQDGNSGIYFLFDGEEIVYIGMSANLMARLGTHTYKRQIASGEFRVALCLMSVDDCKRYEPRWIRLFNPRLNDNFVDPSERVARGVKRNYRCTCEPTLRFSRPEFLEHSRKCSLSRNKQWRKQKASK